MGERLRVVLAEDNLLVREGTKMLLQSTGQVDVVGAAGSASEAREMVETERPDVVITDIRMPPSFQLEGIELALDVRRTFPAIGVVVMSNHDDPEYALTLFHDGSKGLAYLLKERVAEPEELLRAVREVARGGAVIDPKIADVLASRNQVSGGLTDHEQRLLEMMSRGMSYEKMAEELQIPAGAVDSDVCDVLSKLASQASGGASAALTQLRKLHASVIEKEKESVALGQFFSPQVTEAVRTGGTGTRQVEVSVIFTDIRGFTRLSETHDLELVGALLNEHLSAMSELVMKHEGMVDKFIGDAVMAVFGAPVTLPEHAARAVECARAMIAKQAELNATWVARGHPPFGVGIGVNTGEAMAGAVGGTKLEYTVVGDAVNVAQRLNSLAGPGEIIVSADTARAAGMQQQETETHTVKGREKPVTIFRLR